MELENLIDYGLEFYIDDNNIVREIDNTFLNRPNIELVDKKWFFIFQYFNEIHDKNYNDKITSLTEEKINLDLSDTINQNLEKLKYYINNGYKKKKYD